MKKEDFNRFLTDKPSSASPILYQGEEFMELT